MLRKSACVCAGLLALSSSALADPLLDGTYLLTQEFKCAQGDAGETGKFTFRSDGTMSYDLCYVIPPNHYQCSGAQSEFSNNKNTLTMVGEKYHVFYDVKDGIAHYVTLLGHKKGCITSGMLISTEKAE